MANKMPEVGGKKKETSALLTRVYVCLLLYIRHPICTIYITSIYNIRNIVILSFIYILFRYVNDDNDSLYRETASSEEKDFQGSMILPFKGLERMFFSDSLAP